jgi:surfeit locus 1 family protein
MRLGSRRFSPKAWAVLLYVSVLSCMLWLGNWQLDRAALKISLQHSADRARSEAPVPLLSISDLAAAADSYRRVLVHGQYDGERQFLWDNRTHQGQAGYEVIVPMALANGTFTLLNRGWVAPGASRAELPDVSLPEIATGRVIDVEGFLSRPSKGFASGDAVPLTGSWPRVLQYFDYAAISKALGEPIVPVVVQAQALSADGNRSEALTSRPEWLSANWQPAASGPAKHYSYAFQWFAMASALTILFITVNTHKH